MVVEKSATVLQALTEVKKTGGEDTDGERKWRAGAETEEDGPCSCPSVLLPVLRPPAHLDGPSPRLANLLKGACVPGDSGAPPDPPSWLDRDLFDEGRQFYKKYLFCLTFSELLALLVVLAQGHVLKSLIYTGRSDTPARARRRYVSTLLHLMTWFEGDVWDTSSAAHRDIMDIRTTHRRLGHAFNDPEEYEKVRRACVRARGHEQTPTPLVPSFKQDLQEADITPLPETEQDVSPVFISQLDMSLTQYSFMGLILAHPRQLGAAAATPREMEGLVHFWRGLGWLLGVEDEYNFCSGDVEDTRTLCLEVESRILLPRLAAADWNYEHMVHALMTGMSHFLPMLSLPAMLKYLAFTLNVPAPSLASRLSWRNLMQYWLMRVTFGAILLFPKVLRHLNVWFKAVIGKVQVVDRVNLAAYRKSQHALTVPLQDGEGRVGYVGYGRCPVGRNV